MQISSLGALLLLGCLPAWAHDPEAIEVNVPSKAAVLAGTLLLPDDEGKFPCVVLAGGSLSHTRDGGFVGPDGRFVPRDALKRLADKLAAEGYASLRWDKRGRGKTPAGPRPPEIEDDVADVIAAIQFVRQHPRVSRVIVAGESAGAYFACLASKQGYPADAYIFLGALCSDYEGMYAYNYGRLKEYADRSPENLRWAEQTALDGLATGEHYKQMFEAARRGDKSYTVSHGEHKRTIGLDRLRTQTNVSIADQFRYIRGASLVLHGSLDMNVPPEDAASAERIMKESGNEWVTRVMIDGVDHSFQVAPADADTRFRERYSFDSFKRPYSDKLYATISEWLKKTVPAGLADAGATPTKPSELRPGIIAWNGIQVIEDVTDARRHPGIETLEGRIGPLMKGDKSQAHYIDMPPGLFLAEHPHSTESIIYCVRGQFVLCSGGRRQLMKPGSLMWFKANEPTGWEVPFDEPAYILIFKGSRSEKSDDEFLDYLRGLAEKLNKEQADGTPYHFRDLPADHPAREFARKVNPDFEAKLPLVSAINPQPDPNPQAIRPFTIRVGDAVLAELRERLARTRWPDTIEGSGWEYGVDLAYLKELVEYWRTKYDWREQERRLSQIPQFVTEIDGIDLHFLHVRSKEPGALPLVIIHGWPGSFVEFTKIIGPLTDPVTHGGKAEDAFHVICPSLPGFGFSGKPREPGWSSQRMAETIAKLMARLGYERYGAQGGDWGAGVTRWLAAWVVDKFWAWSDHGGNLENSFTKDELLTNVMIYWVTGTMPSSVRIYYESSHNNPRPSSMTPFASTGKPAPMGFALFPKEINVPPRAWVERNMEGSLVHWTEMPRGGHFAAMEQPELLVEDVRKCFRTLRIPPESQSP